MDLGPVKIEGVTATDPAGPARSLAALDSRVPRGQMIGRFIVIDQLGAGAGGIVVSAYDPDLDRKVALKVLRPDQVYSGSIGRARERLLREAKAVARIAHPNIITVHEAGSVGEQVYVAMEYVDGGTLRDTLSLRRRGWQQVLELLVPAARGLSAAHDAGMVHRDFKPANVLVGRDNRVVVSDFGLVSTSRDEDETDDDPSGPLRPVDPSLTDTGTTLGTPAYMAPEQHRGANVDARSDQFAFCVTLFEALYGVRPFTGDTLLDLMAAKENGDIAKPPSGDIPSWLRQVALRGLSPDPAKRFGSMSELVSVIESHRKEGRIKGWLGLAAVAVAIPIAIVAYRSLTVSTPPPPNDEIADLRAELEAKDAELIKNRAELEETRARNVDDPSVIAALEVRNEELAAQLEKLRDALQAREPARDRKKRDPFPRPNLKAASTFELPSRENTGPNLPREPEPEIVSSVFANLRSEIEQCAGLPDLGVDRSYEEWRKVMDRPIDVEIGVRLRIEPDGRASKVKVTAHDSGVRACVAVRVRRARFPVSIEGGPARYSYSLID